MLPPPIDYKHDRNNIELSSLIGISVLGFTLVAVAASFSILTSDSNIWAVTRGTMHDDLLISDIINSSNQTDQMTIAEATGMQGSQNARSEFIYGDYGNDEIQGSSRSDHLSGGPGSDMIYGNDGGDFIQGGPGIDSLYGGAGDDVLSGGEGADYFDCGPGRDSIDDFNSSEGDYALNNCEILENEERPSR